MTEPTSGFQRLDVAGLRHVPASATINHRPAVDLVDVAAAFLAAERAAALGGLRPGEVYDRDGAVWLVTPTRATLIRHPDGQPAVHREPRPAAAAARRFGPFRRRGDSGSTAAGLIAVIGLGMAAVTLAGTVNAVLTAAGTPGAALAAALAGAALPVALVARVQAARTRREAAEARRIIAGLARPR